MEILDNRKPPLRFMPKISKRLKREVAIILFVICDVHPLNRDNLIVPQKNQKGHSFSE